MKKIQINPDKLKIYALIAMTVDHVAEYLPVPGAVYQRMFIGRTAFPIFAFLLMYHLCQKQIYEKYVNRLLFFGILTAVVLFFLQPYHQLNIFFTFLFPVLTLWGWDEIRRENMNKIIGGIFGGIILVFMGFLSLFASYFIPGYFYLLCFYAYFRYDARVWIFPLLIFSFLINLDTHIGYGLVSLITTLFLLHVDMSARYPRLIKTWWLFYVYFPLHLILILSVRSLLS